MNASRNKTALLIVADDPPIADTLGYFLDRGYTVITASGRKEAHIEAARRLAHDNLSRVACLPGINRMTRYNRIDILGRAKRPPVQNRPETPPKP